LKAPRGHAAKQRVEKWRRWIDVIQRDLGRLLLRRTLFKDLVKMRDENPRLTEHGDAFFGFLSEIYVDSVVIGIRRQLKVHPDGVSLVGLLREIADGPNFLTREGYYDLWRAAGYADPDSLPSAQGDFDAFAGRGGALLDPAVPSRDLKELKRIAAACERYADRRIAHRDKRASAATPTPKDVYDSLDRLEKLTAKYFLLLTGSGLDVEPHLQLPIWYAFTFPWKPPPPGEGGRR
jgi:hypothetical protein